MYVLDTNILIYQATDEKDTTAFFDAHRFDIFYVPSVVIAEFLSYPLITDTAILDFRSFLSQTIIVNLDFQIAELAAKVRRQYNVKLIDAVVASTAMSTNATLVTKNTRDFKKIRELTFFEF